MHRTSRSQALPKRSLFGSVLERIHSEEVDDILQQAEREQTRVNVKQPIRFYPEPKLPDKYQPIRHRFDEEQQYLRDKFHIHSEKLKQIDLRMRRLEDVGKYGGGSLMHLESNSASRKPRERSGTPKTSDHSQMHYSRGILPSLSVNQSSGGVVMPSFESNIGAATAREYQLSPRTLRRLQIERQMGPRETTNQHGLLIPMNIVHKIGFLECERILSDEKGFSEFLPSGGASSRRVPLTAANAPPSKKLTPYDNLGQIMRYNILPGRDQFVRQSEMKGHYTNDAIRQLTSDANESETSDYRFKWDPVSRWAEANVIQQRVVKAWNEKESDMKVNTKAAV